MPKKPPAPIGPKPGRRPPEEIAREAVARLEAASSGRVYMTFRLALPRLAAEALVAESIRRERNIGTYVEEILEQAAAGVAKKRAV